MTLFRKRKSEDTAITATITITITIVTSTTSATAACRQRDQHTTTTKRAHPFSKQRHISSCKEIAIAKNLQDTATTTDVNLSPTSS